MSTTEVLTIETVDYELKTRLPWMEQAKIEDQAFRFYVDGSALSSGEGLDNIEELEMRPNTAQHTLARLRARLVIKRRDIPGLPPAHVAILVDRIAELEDEESAEIEALKDGNPTATN